MASERVLSTIMGIIYGLYLIPGIIFWIYIPKIGKCVSKIGLRSAVLGMILLIGFGLLIAGGVSQQFFLAIVLLVINLGFGLFFLYRYIIHAKATHTWNGCKCTKCGEIDSSKHKVNKKNCTCKTCGEEFHDMDGCTCRLCGKTIHESSFGICACIRCGQELHRYYDAKCIQCGKISPDHKHTFRLLEVSHSGRAGADMYKCDFCGEVAYGEEIGLG
jgi:hypothetical protein